MYKKLLLIICILFVFNINSAFADDSILTDIGLGIVWGIPMVISLIIGFVFAGGLFIIGGVLMIPTAIYYKSIEVANYPENKTLVEVKLCPAALDLELNIDKDFPNITITTLYNPPVVNAFKSLPELPNKDKQLNSSVNSFCEYCENQPKITPENKEKYKYKKFATGVWKPIQAFTYFDTSYVNLIQFKENGNYETLLVKFEDIYFHLTYNNHYIFRNYDSKSNLSVRNLCINLKEKSVHKLYNKTIKNRG